MKKKWLMSLTILLLVILLICGAIIYYIAPSRELTMDYTPVRVEDKVVAMIAELTPEFSLNKSEINALLKSNLNPELNDYATIKGADFYVENNQLFGELDVLLYERVHAQIHVTYNIVWQEPKLVLQPVAISAKEIPLPVGLLKEISFPLYEDINGLVSIKDIYTRASEVVISLSFHLFR